MKLRYPIIVAAMSLAACSDALNPPAGLEHSIATPTCGPADEPYIAIFLADEPFSEPAPRTPYLLLQIPRGFPELRGGQSWQIGPYPSGSSAWFHETELSSFIASASSGTIRISGVGANAIKGSIDLRFPDGTRFRGGFDAAWKNRQTFCG